jgi:hypothetical protein
MNGLLEITTDSLKRDLGIEVPEIYVVIAKHSVMGMDRESIIELLGCESGDLTEVESDENYRLIRQYVAGRYAQMGVDQTAGWDQIENIAIQNLVKRLPFEKDGDFLLRVAAVANKAQRRHQKQTGILDPSLRTGRTVITLTQRLTQKLNGQEELQETRQLSISDGSMQNPNFDEVDSLLSVSSRPVLPKNIEIKTRSRDLDLEELTRFMGDSL